VISLILHRAKAGQKSTINEEEKLTERTEPASVVVDVVGDEVEVTGTDFM